MSVQPKLNHTNLGTYVHKPTYILPVCKNDTCCTCNKSRRYLHVYVRYFCISIINVPQILFYDDLFNKISDMVCTAQNS